MLAAKSHRRVEVDVELLFGPSCPDAKKNTYLAYAARVQD